MTLARAWHEGVGIGDGPWLEDQPGLEIFAALSQLLSGERVELPRPSSDPAMAVLHAVVAVLDGLLAHAPREVNVAVAGMGLALEYLDDEEPHATAARAWADLALGEVAIAVADLRVARQRFEAIAALPDRPAALRVTAMLRLAALAVERSDLASARSWTRKAASLADAERPIDHDRTQLASGLLAYAANDLSAMRAALLAISMESAQGRIAHLLLATTTRGAEALDLLAETLREAVHARDPLTYALCVLLGARSYRAIGHGEDARVTLDAGIAQLANLAPHLANALIAERDGRSS
ncbi:MAG: hypothetical protein WKG01_30850 [Kofleriaceae bacterium]